jgi:hypothetical protein
VGPDLQDIVDEVSRVLATPVVLEDGDFNLVVLVAHADEVDTVRQRTILQRTILQRTILQRRSSGEVQSWFEAFGIAGSDRPVRTPADPARGIVARVCLPARWNGVTDGCLWALDEHRHLDDALLERVMRHAARAGTVMAQRARTRRRLDEQVLDLLTGDAETAEAARAVAHLRPVARWRARRPPAPVLRAAPCAARGRRRPGREPLLARPTSPGPPPPTSTTRATSSGPRRSWGSTARRCTTGWSGSRS